MKVPRPGSLAAVVLAFVSTAAVASCTKGYEPGLGEIMTLNQMRHAKLWYAGQAGNWELADYELDELQEGFEDIVKFHPTHKDAPLPLSELVPKIMDPPIRDLRAAVKAKDAAAFIGAYDAVTAACNRCHETTNFGFNVVRRPSEALWFGNQDFASRR